MIKTRLWLALPLLVLLLGTSCEKRAGKGGSSAIIGKVHIKEYNGLGTLIKEYDIADKDVFIMYDPELDSIYDDKSSTSYEGSYQFRYLAKGKYRMFAYSDCWTCTTGDSAVFVDVEMDKNGVQKTAPVINIIKN